jgi:hypothetical protein
VWLSFSQFRISCTQVFDKLICETVLRSRSQRHNREEPSIGARFQIEGESGLTDHRACLGSKSEIIGSCTDDYFLHRFLVNEIILASSARFPCLNNQSRDRSPPWVWKAISTIKLCSYCTERQRQVRNSPLINRNQAWEVLRTKPEILSLKSHIATYRTIRL